MPPRPGSESPTVLITGAGSGLGEAMAERFAGEGYRVAVCDIDQDRADAVLARISGKSPGSFSHCMDVCRTQDWDAVYLRVLTEWGGLNVLVNNAGVAAAGNCEESPLEDWRWVIDVDLMGVVYGCHRFIPLLRDTASESNNACHLVNVASFAGIAGMPGMCAYGTAKAAVIALSEQLRAELFDAGIGVSVVCPAFVQTKLLETFRAGDNSYRSRVEKWMAHSTVTAQDVASQTFDAVVQGRFLVLTHALTRKVWRWKRWMPERYFQRMISTVRRKGGQSQTSGES